MFILPCANELPVDAGTVAISGIIMTMSIATKKLTVISKDLRSRSKSSLLETILAIIYHMNKYANSAKLSVNRYLFNRFLISVSTLSKFFPFSCAIFSRSLLHFPMSSSGP